MPVGAKMLREKVAKDLGLDEELVASILSDASINISSSISGMLAPFIKQLTISKDFIERHQGCRISQIYISGGLSLFPSWGAEVEQNAGGACFNTGARLKKLNTTPVVFQMKWWRRPRALAGAIGAAMGGIEVS